MPTAVARLARQLGGLPPHERDAALRSTVAGLTLPERFDLLHRLGVYHHPESLSGAASSFAETAALRAALARLVRRHQVRSLLDVPCGDFAWMAHAGLDVEYTGADVVPAIVAGNRQRHSAAGRTFLVLDATHDPLPRADLVLCRDLLIHLGNDDTRAVLDGIVASGSRLLLTNHFVDCTRNVDIVSGDFRPVNLCRSPFDLPPPLEIVSEESNLAFADRAVALWRVADVATRLASAARG